MNPISFTVPGKPATKGSRRNFAVKRAGAYTGKVISIGDCEREKAWQASVSIAAGDAMKKAGNTTLEAGPVSLIASFFFMRPKGHLKPSGETKPKAPTYPVASPDIDKLERCLYDGMTGVVYKDDRQICHSATRKRYGAIPGVEVTVQPLTNP